MTRCLSIHAAYRCRHSGACCADVWAVPAEPRVIQLVHIEGIRWAGAAPFVTAPAGAAARRMVLAHHDGACAFYERGNGLCAIHHAAGPEALPASCRHFPRASLHDTRGWQVSLSHFCPTAARMLLDDVPLRIVEAPAALALGGELEGLDAADALPPLLRRGLLTDLDGYDAWVRAGIATLARADMTHQQALAAIARATRMLDEWAPGGESMRDAVERAFARVGADEPDESDGADLARLRLIAEACPVDARPAVGPTLASADVLETLDGPIKRYLAARLFANWMAYRNCTLAGVVEWLRICLALLRHQLADTPDFVAAVRETDRVVLHVVDSQRLAGSIDA